MRARTLILQMSVIAACIAFGIALDRHLLAPRRAAPLPRNVPAVTTPSTSSPIAGTNDSDSAGVAARARSAEKKLATLAEVLAAIDDALTNRTFSARQEALDRLLGQINADLA